MHSIYPFKNTRVQLCSIANARRCQVPGATREPRSGNRAACFRFGKPRKTGVLISPVVEEKPELAQRGYIQLTASGVFGLHMDHPTARDKPAG